MNNSLRFGHIINVEQPAYLHGALADAAPLAEYVAEILRIRRSLGNVFWDSRLVPLDLEIDHDGALLSSVHESLDGERRAVVITHLEETPQSGEIRLSGVHRAMLYRPFEQPQEVRLPLTLSLPVDRVAVLVADR